MDAMMNDAGGFHAAANLAEIWPFPINAGGDTAPYGLAASHNASDVNRDRHIPMNDPMIIDRSRTNHRGGSARNRREDDESAKGVSTSGNGLSESDSKRLKATGSRESSADGEGNSRKAEQSAKPAEPPKDYIHVRARRGQATDNHSLAERARREKISERMKVLQDIVPGCNKVEFLSMKLEAVNSRITPSIEGFPTKDFGQQTFDTNAMAFGSQATREYARGTSPDWLHMQIGGGFDRTT